MKTMVKVINGVKPMRVLCSFFYLKCLILVSTLAYAQDGGFSGGVSPARVILEASPGEVARQTLSIYNFGNTPQVFKIQTNEWEFSEAGKLSFQDKLKDGSCRKWVKLERHEIKVLPGGKIPRKYRFEVHVPKEAKPRECRFAIVVETSEDPYRAELKNASIAMPTTGKIAVIVYLNIGGVKPKLKKLGLKTKKVRGKKQTFFIYKNDGEAHDRLDSSLFAKDSTGKKLKVSVATSPILPGQTRELKLSFDDSTAEGKQTIAYPIEVYGKIYSKTKTFEISEVIK